MRPDAPARWGISLEAALGVGAGSGAARHISVDGKRLRGGARAAAPGVHLLAAFSDARSGVAGQLQMLPGNNDITAALDLLPALPLEDGVVTGDTIFAQMEICRVIPNNGSGFTVGDDQPTLKAGITLAFGGFPPSAAKPPDLTCAETAGKEHGRVERRRQSNIETRTLKATASLAVYLGPVSPGLAGVRRITRRLALLC